MEIKIKRIYEEKEMYDGIRILVDRLWPRGISKERAQLDYWLKDIAPSHELRKFYHHQRELHEEFKILYEDELAHNEKCQDAVLFIMELAKRNPITLLYAAKDPLVNHAIILKHYLEKG